MLSLGLPNEIFSQMNDLSKQSNKGLGYLSAEGKCFRWHEFQFKILDLI